VGTHSCIDIQLPLILDVPQCYCFLLSKEKATDAFFSCVTNEAGKSKGLSLSP
jgi:hypothetical protein